jgi:hypothetical protein
LRWRNAANHALITLSSSGAVQEEIIIIMCGGTQCSSLLEPPALQEPFYLPEDPLLLLLWCSEIVLIVQSELDDNSLIGVVTRPDAPPRDRDGDSICLKSVE